MCGVKWKSAGSEIELARRQKRNGKPSESFHVLQSGALHWCNDIEGLGYASACWLYVSRASSVPVSSTEFAAAPVQWTVSQSQPYDLRQPDLRNLPVI